MNTLEKSLKKLDDRSSPTIFIGYARVQKVLGFFILLQK